MLVQIGRSIMFACYDMDDYCPRERDVHSRSYEIEYKTNNTVEVSLIDIYVVNNKFQKKCKHKKTFYNVSLKDFFNFTIDIYNAKMNIGSFGDIQFEDMLKKIEIKNIK